MALTHERAERSTIGIRKGDQVRVIAGRDAGKNGRVLSVNAKKTIPRALVLRCADLLTGVARLIAHPPSSNRRPGLVEDRGQGASPERG